MQDSKLCRFKIFENSGILQDFEWLCWNSDQNSQNFGEIHGIPVKLTEHLLQDFQCCPRLSMGGVWIFSGIAHFTLLEGITK